MSDRQEQKIPATVGTVINTSISLHEDVKCVGKRLVKTARAISTNDPQNRERIHQHSVL